MPSLYFFSTFAHSIYNMCRYKHYILCCIGFFLFLSVVVATLFYWEKKAQLQPASRVAIEVKQYYSIRVGEKDIAFFSAFSPDTAVHNIAFTPDSITLLPIRYMGQFVHAIPTLPTCCGLIRIAPPREPFSSRIHYEKVSGNILKSVLKRLKRDVRIERIYLDELRYYMRTHSVLDEGFHLLANRRIYIDSLYRTHLRLLHLLRSMNLQHARIVKHERYTAIYYDRKQKIQQESCRVVKAEDSTIYLRLASARTPDYVSLYAFPWRKMLSEKAILPPWNVRLQYEKGYLRSYMQQRADTTYYGILYDSTSVYKGELNRHAVPTGQGVRYFFDGNYYEGNWQEGMLQNFGFSLSPIRSMRAGEWQADVYKGDRLTHAGNRIYGIDISRHQHEKGSRRYSIDWQNLRIVHLGSRSPKRIRGKVDFPVRFIFIKSTEGTTVRNAYFSSDHRAAHSHGIPVGAYHFFSLHSSGKAQALYFLKHTTLQKGDLPPVLDVEPTHRQIVRCGGTEVMWREIRAWLSTVEQRTGTRPILYVSQMFVNRYLSLVPDIKQRYRVWIARYGEYKPDVRLAIWQLGQDGLVQGIHGYVDINVLNGYEEELGELIRQGIR